MVQKNSRPRTGPTKPNDAEYDGRSREAQRTLDRIQSEGGLTATPKLENTNRSVTDHFLARDVTPGDPIEIWGTRIGRALAVGAFVLLAIWLIGFFGRNN